MAKPKSSNGANLGFEKKSLLRRIGPARGGHWAVVGR